MPEQLPTEGTQVPAASGAPETSIFAAVSPQNANVLSTKIMTNPDVAAAIDQHRANGPGFAETRQEYRSAVQAARGIVEAPTTPAAGSNTEGGSTAPAPAPEAAPAIGGVSAPVAEASLAMPAAPTGAEGGVPQGPVAPPQA
jgi:hypothetical protein